jgi:hypothetical protein
MTFPYHDVKVSDPAKLARMTDAYRAYRRGELDRSLLPDIRDVLPDDPQRLAEMGLMTEPGCRARTCCCKLVRSVTMIASIRRCLARAFARTSWAWVGVKETTPSLACD